MPIRQRELASGLVLNLSGKDQSLDDRDHELLRRGRVLRVDPSNSCNAACVFCESSFSSRGARLPLAVFEEALATLGRSPFLDTLQFGCTYEPTIRKDFSEFGRILERTRLDRIPDTLSIVSNCWLLDRHDLEPFVKGGLNKLHVSLHSHEAREFEAVMGHDYLSRVTENLKGFKSRFPHVVVSAVCVVNTLNVGAPLDFARWAFSEVGVDYLRFTRANIVGKSPASPAMAALEQLPAGSSYEVSDDAWSAFVARARDVKRLGLELLESRQNLKNSAITVDALRLKRRGAPSEVTAIRLAGANRPTGNQSSRTSRAGAVATA